MSYDYFVRITHPYAAIASLVGAWALRCQKLVVYEHVGTQTEKIHCHILILNSKTHKKQLRNIGQSYAMLKGNEYCSFKECVTYETPVVYMTKGIHDPKYFMGFTKEELDKLKGQWVEPNNYVPPSGNLAIFNTWQEQHMDALYENILRHNEEKDWFNIVKKHMQKYIFEKNNRIWDMKCITQYKMLVLTHCMRQKIPIPTDSKWSDWL
jgi:hypothetical protein